MITLIGCISNRYLEQCKKSSDVGIRLLKGSQSKVEDFFLLEMLRYLNKKYGL